MKYDKQYFEEQSARLKKVCASWKKEKRTQARNNKVNSERLAKHILKSGYQFPLVTWRNREWIKELREKGATVDDIAIILKCDIVTIAAIIEEVL